MSIIIDPSTGNFSSNDPGWFVQRIDTNEPGANLANFKLSNGIDVPYSTQANDNISSTEKDDVIYAYDGDDFIQTGDGDDRVYGGSGRDTIFGGAGDDLVFGNQGDDSIDGGGGNDTLYGGKGNDEIDGGFGDDLIYGNQGSDNIRGGEGADTVYGGQGNDTIDGGLGNDQISGDKGNDLLTGGAGADAFVFSGDFTQLGLDTVTDFNTGEGDTIRLDKQLFGADPVRQIDFATEFAVVQNFSGSTNGTSTAKIIYDSATGLLYYNLSTALGNEAPFVQLQPGLDPQALFNSLEMF